MESSSIRKNLKQKIFVCMLVLLCDFFFACGDQPEKIASHKISETGALDFKVIWLNRNPKSAQLEQNYVTAESVPDICNEGVTTVEAIVYFEGGRRNGGPWSCSEGKGTITNIEAGNNRTVVIIGKNGTSPTYRGSISGVTVTTGETTDAGEIECLYFVPEALEPANESEVVEGEYQLRWRGVESAERYQIQLSAESNFQTKIVDTAVQQTTYLPPSNLIGRGTYYWRLRAEDGQGNLGAWTSALSFTVTYTIFNVTSESGDGGSISPSGENNVQAGDDLSFSIVPQTGFFIKEVIVDGESIHGRPNEYTFPNINETHSIRAVFIPGLYVDGQISVANPDGLSWETAYSSIQDAIDESHPTEESEIWVMEGEYALNETINVARPVSIYGGFDGEENIFGDRNWVVNKTTIDGQDSVRCIDIQDKAVIDGFQVEYGNGVSYGGGIYIRNDYNVVSTLINCTLVSNEASRGGGAVCIDSCSPKIINCYIVSNDADRGAGIYCRNYGEPKITNCTILFNRADTSGGAYSAAPGEFMVVEATFSNCILWGNYAGLNYNEIDGYSSHAIVTHSAIEVYENDPFTIFPGERNISDDPEIRYDWTSQTMLIPKLPFGSPCIDKGIEEGLPFFDIEGDNRVAGSTVDIGADEYVPQE
jgi:hypothetical protein